MSSKAHALIRNENQLLTKEKLVNNDGSKFSLMFAYGHSKMCNVLFTKSLGRQFQKMNVNVGSYSLHPGVVSTNVFRNEPGIVKALLFILSLYTLKTPESGAQTQIHLALEKMEKLTNGGYYDECKLGKVAQVANSEKAQDELWQLSEELCRDFSTL